MKKKIVQMVMMVWIAGLALGLAHPSVAEEKPAVPGEGTTVATADQEDADRPTASADVAFLSQYIWRGYALSKDSLVIQPSVAAAYKGFSLNVWGNLDTDSYQGAYKGDSKWNETDLTFGYETSFGILGVGAGFIYYALDGVDDWKEFYLSLGLDTLLAPSLTVYREVSKNQGWYVLLGIFHSFELPREMTLDLAGSVSYWGSDNDNMMERNSDLSKTTKRFSGLHDGLVSVGLTIPFWKYFSVTPSIAYAFPLSHQADNEIRASSWGQNANHVFGGVTLSLAF
jgi:hypothetical protein